MNSPIVSVIVPVFNTAEYLIQCLDSIINQTLEDIEIICVDDGSSDESLDILHSYEQKDLRIKVLTQKHSNAGAARNYGMKYATGKYLSFLDSDDFFECDMLEKAYNTAVLNSSDIVVFRSDSFLEDKNEYINTQWTIQKKWLPNNMPFSATDVSQNFFMVFVGWPWDKLFSSELIKTNQILFQEQRTTNDMLFVFSALLKAKRITVIDDILAHQRQRKSSISVNREKSFTCFLEAFNALKLQLINWNLFERFERDYINYCLHFSVWNLKTLAWPEKEQLYNMLKDGLFEQMGLKNQNREYFYNEKEYIYYRNIINHSYEYTFPGTKGICKVIGNTEGVMMPKVSVIMPSLNVASFIRKCIESVLNQSLKDIEIICVDAGSTDGTFEILQEYERNDNRVRLIKSEKKSYGYQMNIGLAAAKGLYVGIVETDDFVDPIMFEYLLAKAEHFGADIVKSNYWKYATYPDEHNVYFELLEGLPYNRILSVEEKKRFIQRTPSIWSGIYRRAFLIDNLIYFVESLGASYQDTSFFIKASMGAQNIILVPEAFLHYRIDNTESSVKSKGKIFCVCDEMDAVDAWMNERPDLKKIYEREVYARRLESYRWNYFRLPSDHSRATFLQRMHTDLAALVRERGWNPQTLGEGQRALLLKIVDEPSTFLAENRVAPESEDCPPPKVSVVLALKQGPAPYLSECLSTLQSQNLQEIEVLCICSDEDDGPLKTLQIYADVDPRFVIHLTGQDTKLNERRNLGLSLAQAEYVFFAESHIFYQSFLLSRVLDAAKQESADVVLFDGKNFDYMKQIPVVTNKYIQRNKLRNQTFAPVDLSSDLLQLTADNTWTKLYNTNYIRKEELKFQETDNQSTPYFAGATLMLAEKITTIPNYLAYIRVNDPTYRIEDEFSDKLMEYDALWQLLNERNKLPLMDATFCQQLVLLLDIGLHSEEKKHREQVLEWMNSEHMSVYRLFERPLSTFSDSSIETRLKTMQGALAWHQRETERSTRQQTATPLSTDTTFVDEIAPIKVSVIIPIYNAEKYLDETLTSICGQTLKEIEIICVDDGSTDNSGAILEEWAKKDKRIRVFKQPNGGQSRARNTGIEYALGEYLYFIDSDDILDTSALTELYNLSCENQLDMLFFDAISFYDSEADIETFKFKPLYHRVNKYDGIYTGQELFELLLHNHEYYMSPCLSITKRKHIIEHNIRFYEGSIHEDNLYTFQTLLSSKYVSCICIPYYKRRIRKSSTMTRKLSFENAYSYYVMGLEMLAFYSKFSDNFSDSVKESALSVIKTIFEFSVDIFENLDTEEKGAQFSIGNNFILFNRFISSLADARIQIKKCNNLMLKYSSVKNIERRILDYLAKCAECRIDMKLEGSSSHKLSVIHCDQTIRYWDAPWLAKNGTGLTFQSESGKIDVTVKCENAGTLKLWIMGADYRDSQGNRVLIWVDYQNLTINNKNIISESYFASHDHPYYYEMNVDVGEIVTVYAECLPDGFKNSNKSSNAGVSKSLPERSSASEKALEAKVAALTEQQVRKAFTDQTGGEWPCVSFPYGDVAKQQYAELRASGPSDNRVVSVVSLQEDGQKRFNTLLNSDGSPNWVTPEELKKSTEHFGTSERALEAKVTQLTKQLQEYKVTLEEVRKVLTGQRGEGPCVSFPYGDAAKQQYAKLRTSGSQDKRTVSFVTQQEGQMGVHVLLNSNGNRNWVTPEELKKAVQASSENASLRFRYGDVAKQQYAELRSNGPQHNLSVSLVTRQDGKTQFNTLLDSDGTRNWVTPKELKTITERSGASETALEAKIVELTGKLERLQALYDSLAEKRKVNNPKRSRRKMYRWKNR